MPRRTETRPFECNTCGRKYASQSSLNRHNSQKHPPASSDDGEETDAVPPSITIKPRIEIYREYYQRNKQRLARNRLFDKFRWQTHVEILQERIRGLLENKYDGIRPIEPVEPSYDGPDADRENLRTQYLKDYELYEKNYAVFSQALQEVSYDIIYERTMSKLARLDHIHLVNNDVAITQSS